MGKHYPLITQPLLNEERQYQIMDVAKQQPLLTRRGKRRRVLRSVGLGLLTPLAAVISPIVFLKAPGGFALLGFILIFLSMLMFVVLLAYIPRYLSFLGRRGHYLLGLGIGTIPFVVFFGLLNGTNFFVPIDGCGCSGVGAGLTEIVLFLVLVYYILELPAALVFLLTPKIRIAGYGLLTSVLFPVIAILIMYMVAHV